MGDIIDKQALFHAKQRLNRFLEEFPHMKESQKKLDVMLDGAGNAHNRMLLLNNLMQSHLGELNRRLFELSSELTKLQKFKK